MYKIIIDCYDVDQNSGSQTALEIEREFREHRTWFKFVDCCYADEILTLTAMSDVDASGIALLDEFGDCLSAYLSGHGRVVIRSVERSTSSDA